VFGALAEGTRVVVVLVVMVVGARVVAVVGVGSQIVVGGGATVDGCLACWTVGADTTRMDAVVGGPATAAHHRGGR
jgi:hypothetical protein